jgi:hypothetical protein
MLNQADCLERLRSAIRGASKIKIGLTEDELNKIEIEYVPTVMIKIDM